MTAPLIESLATTDALAAVFSDHTVLQAMLDVEVALARVQARLGVIPQKAADAIAAAAAAGPLDASAMAREVRDSGTIAIPLVQALTARVRAADPDGARFVHWGATSQDIADTALVLLILRARSILADDHDRLERGLRQLSDQHAGTVMLGRTLLQPAPPITFGLKVAGWSGALLRGWSRLSSALAEASVVQFGGASGTLAALGPQGIPVARALAAQLGLEFPDAPWHAHRDRLASVVTTLGVYTGTLGKVARDVSLLMQHEVAEAAEPGGGSSTLPHKRNPVGCAVAIAAATRMPGLVAAFLTGMVQEHERSVGGWHAEPPTVAAVVQTAGAALASIADVIEGLTVDPDRMRANITATNGVIFAERAMMHLAPHVGREVAHRLLADAVERSRRTNRALGDVLRETPEIAGLLVSGELHAIDSPEEYLGSAEAFRRQLMSAAQKRPAE